MKEYTERTKRHVFVINDGGLMILPIDMIEDTDPDHENRMVDNLAGADETIALMPDEMLQLMHSLVQFHERYLATWSAMEEGLRAVAVEWLKECRRDGYFVRKIQTKRWWWPQVRYEAWHVYNKVYQTNPVMKAWWESAIKNESFPIDQQRLILGVYLRELYMIPDIEGLARDGEDHVFHTKDGSDLTGQEWMALADQTDPSLNVSDFKAYITSLVPMAESHEKD